MLMVTAQLLLVFPVAVGAQLLLAESLICTVVTAAALCPLLSNTVELDHLNLRIILTNRAYINFRLECTCHWENPSHWANQSNKGSRYVTGTEVTQMSSEKVSPCLNDYWEKSTFTAHELGQNLPFCLSFSRIITTSVFWCGLMDKHHRRVNAQSYSLCFQHPTSVCLMWRINKSSSVRGREHRPWWRPFTPLTNGCLSRWVLFWPREQRQSKNSLNTSNWTREAWIDLKLKKGRLI